MNFRQVHLDFHTSEKIDNIGKEFSKENFQKALKIGHIDSITLFSKCHHGWAYHPSKTNKMHPGLDFDLLKAQIEAAHEIGVKTPVYLSAGCDEKAVREHPEWRFENIDHYFDNFSKPGYHWLCMNTPYLDYLLEQIKEVVTNYDADGIFLDIVGVRPCCCGKCMGDMLKLGMNPNDMKDIVSFGERVYKNYLKRVRETIDSVKPGLPVFHNGGHIRQGRRDLAFANSHFELESLPTGGWGYDHFPISARYIQNLGREYLGMTGKFHNSWGEFGGFKHPNALRYEVMLSAAHGAKCSIGDQLLPNGKMDMTTYEIIGKAYGELEEKEEWIKDAKPVCDVALLSYETILNLGISEDRRTSLTLPDIGAGRILIEGNYQFSIVDSEVDFNQYKVMILPDDILLNDELKEKLKAFIKNGGKILASGNSGIENNKFVFDFGAQYDGEGEYQPSYIRMSEDANETDYIMYSPYNKIKLTDGKTIANVAEPYFNRTAEHFCSHKHSPSSGICKNPGVVMGKDGIYIAWKIFTDYAENGELIAKNTVIKALDLLLGNEKILVTNLASMGVATLFEQENRYVAHLLYAVPTKRGKNTEIIEDIYPVSDITLKLKLQKTVKGVYLAPQKTEIPYKYENGYVKVENITVDCHQMIVFNV